jgi:uncharacterized protein
MGLKEELENGLRQAMRENDVVGKRTLRLILANIKLAEVENRNLINDENKIIALLQKEIKMKQETISDAKKGNREDIIRENEQDIDIINKYLPKQLQDEELRILVRAVIEELGASSMADMSTVMKTTLKRAQGQAPSEKISYFVKQELSKNP